MNKVVLDTNVVFDLLFFGDAAVQPLRQALEGGRLRCVVSEATFDEWSRVLAYPEFGLDVIRQATLRERYRALSSRQSIVAVDGLPRCSDPDDQKFLELAAASGAGALVSKDRALLKLRRRCRPLFQVLTPAEAADWLQAMVFSPVPAAGT